MDNIIKDLYKVIEERKILADENSYTAYLLKKGNEKILKKVGEETTELVIATMKDDKEEQVLEMCDLIYHLLVLCNNNGIELLDIENELKRRTLKLNNFKGERKEVKELR
ncbi:phosphoribosyl-ATP diphosphatase [uncultured Clostridium sp.]|uniref:phosphoribosyl-ATP diphosphatase n=1 Tax=uncultured Clostridium sp. TaxID=59620 RepID=UPI0026026A43|nr:phosphoribosyl-ATP diphosphatase [uncultured Clostridium sp.]